jgi:hypothetical protein
LVGSRCFPKIPAPNRPWISISRRVELSFTHTTFELLHLHFSTCALFVFSSILELARAIRRAWLLGRKERNLGMNTMRISSKVLRSFYYSSAYELDYSSHVIILTYEPAYSLCVMISTCSTLCLSIHMTCMSRSRAKLRWWFIIPLGLPMSYAC